MAAVLSFSLLLTWVFILYQPTPGPGELQRMGWQAWDAVPNTTPQSDSETVLPGAGDSPIHEESDWWNVTTEQKQPDPITLPLDVWSPLLPHDTGRMSLQL